MSSPKNIWLAWSGLAVAVLIGALVLVYPGYHERHRIDGRLDELDVMVARLAIRTGEVVELATRVEEYKRRIDTELRFVPDAPQVADLVRVLSLPVDDVTITDQTFTASTPTNAVIGSDSPMRTMPLTVEMKATFDSIFALVRGAESMTRLVRVSSLRIAGEPSDDGLASPLLTASIGLDAIYMDQDESGGR